MAARTTKVRHDENTRLKIQASQIINRLQDYIFGKISMEAGQVTASLGLLKKTIPDLSASDNKTEVTHKYVADVPAVSETVEQWQQQHSPTLQ